MDARATDGKASSEGSLGAVWPYRSMCSVFPTSDLKIPVPGINPKAIIPNVCIYLCSTISDCNGIYDSK